MSRLVPRPGLRVRYGTGALSQLGSELERLGIRRPLVLHGASIGANAGLRERVAASVGTGPGHHATHWFAAVAAHSPLETVRASVAAVREHEADGLVALGGGSAVVTARATAILAAEQGDLVDLATRRGPGGELVSPRLAEPKLPIVVLPTTPSTAFGKAGTAVTLARHRYSMFDPKTRAAAILVDPDLLASAPIALLRDAALNACAMAVEGLASSRANPFADAELAHALKLLGGLLPGLGDLDAPAELRTTLCLCALLVGSGTDTTGGGAVAGLSHTIGHRYPHLHNGRVDAVLLPHVVDALVTSAPANAENVARMMSAPLDQLATRVRSLLATAAPATRLRDLGVAEVELEHLAEAALDDFAMASSPLPATRARLLGLLRAAW